MRNVVRVVGIALLSALTLIIGTGTSAFAAQPGEESNWHQQFENGAPLRHRGFTETRDSYGRVLQAWRGYDNNNIWISIDNGQPYAFPSAQSYATPQIIFTAYGPRVYHTGTDGHIYYAGFTYDAYQHVTTFGSWQQVPSNVVTPNDQSPSVTPLWHPGQDTTDPDNGGESVYLSWRGVNSAQIYGSYFYGVGANRYPNNWHLPTAIPGATSNVAPGIAYNRAWGRIVLTWAGEDTHVYVASQLIGHGDWSAAERVGSMTTVTRPAIALTNSGAGQIAVIPYANGWSGGTTELIDIYRASDRPSGVLFLLWTGEITGNNWGDIFLSANGTDVNMNATTSQHYDYWKHSGSF
ncbi:hypothetical protein [Streptomyces sp. NPDC057428]|uniref:hypothetical protein n=1 Tax=Streptomyces sp. NPDC057428 TaxID=3346129 RepID=UPI0036AF40FF